MEEKTKSQRAYEARRLGLYWSTIAQEIDVQDPTAARMLAAYYAKKNNLDWPLSIKVMSTRSLYMPSRSPFEAKSQECNHSPDQSGQTCRSCGVQIHWSDEDNRFIS